MLRSARTLGQLPIKKHHASIQRVKPRGTIWLVSQQNASLCVLCNHGFMPRHFPLRSSMWQKERLVCFSTDNQEVTEQDRSAPSGQTVDPPASARSNENPSKILTVLNSNHPGAVQEALQLWRNLVWKQKNQEETEEKPSHLLAEALIEQLVARIDNNNKDPVSAAAQAHTIVLDLRVLYKESKDPDFHPSLACYHKVILAWVKGNCPSEAERVFRELLLPESLIAVIDSTANPQQLRDMFGQILNSVLRCWAISGKPESGKQVDAILAEVGKLNNVKVGSMMNPNAETCHLVNQAWQSAVQMAADDMNSKDFYRAAQRVHGNVDFMLERANNKGTDSSDWLPNPDVYPWLILAYGHARNPDKANAILNSLIHRDKTPNLRLPAPTTAMYNHVLEAFAHQGKGKEAALLLSRWVSKCQLVNEKLQAATARSEESSEPARKGWCQPDHDSCLLVINAWGSLPDHHRAAKAETILQRMLALEKEHAPNLRVLPSPTVETYNAVLQAWSISRNYKLATPVSQVERLLKDMNRYHPRIKENPCAPNMRTFELILETMARFGYKMGDRRRRMHSVMREIKHHRNMTPSDRCSELVKSCEDANWILEDS
jgi:hypothetical protein